MLEEEILPTHANVGREGRSHLPVVLDVGRIVRFGEVNVGAAAARDNGVTPCRSPFKAGMVVLSAGGTEGVPRH